MPACALAYGLGAVLADDPNETLLGDWGELSLRSFAVGAPVLVLSQNATGGSRPGESSAESDWVPFHDDNGVSGHSFIGAVPFLVAAKRCERPLARWALYVGSAMPAWSRVNDDAHYASQAFLGWAVAFAAVESIHRREYRGRSNADRYSIDLIPTSDGVGLGMTFRR